MTGQINDLSVWHLISGASNFVQLILLILLIGSISSWAIMIQRAQVLKAAKNEAYEFSAEFWANDAITTLYQKYTQQMKSNDLMGLRLLFVNGYTEFVRLYQQGITGKPLIEGVERAMRVSIMEQTDQLEKQISLLGAIASVAPYVGLLGTVWGIMAAFTSLSGVSQVTIAMIAPHIAEALIATAMGLVVAIPAVMGYNHLSKGVDQTVLLYENFQDEFCTLLYQQAYTSKVSDAQR